MSPASGWYSHDAAVDISAAPDGSHSFGGWTGSGAGSYAGPNATATLTMSEPITETANFSQTVVTDAEKQEQMLRMVNAHRGSLPAELVLAVLFQEGGQGAFYADGAGVSPGIYQGGVGPWEQPFGSEDGVMQVQPASRASGLQDPYPGTQAGYDLAIADGCAYLNTQLSRYGTLWESVLHYNTGRGTLFIYKNGRGDPHYLHHVASNLRTLVPPMFGLDNARLADQLEGAQALVDKYVTDAGISSNQSDVAYYDAYQTELDAELHGLGNHPPIARNDSVTVSPTLLTKISLPKLLANDSDPDGDPLECVWSDFPFNSTKGARIEASREYGLLVYNTRLKQLDTGTYDEFTYRVQDGHGGTNQATVFVKYRGISSGPVPNAVSIVSNEDGSLTLKFLGLDGRYYKVQGTPDLKGNWTDLTLLDNNASGILTNRFLCSGSLIVVTDSAPASRASWFYRALLP